MTHFPVKGLLISLSYFCCCTLFSQDIFDDFYILENTHPEKMVVSAKLIKESDTPHREKTIFYSMKEEIDSTIMRYKNVITEKVNFTRGPSSHSQTTILFDSNTGALKTIRKTRYINGLVDYTRNVDPVQQDSTTIQFIRDDLKNISKIETYANGQKLKVDCIHIMYDNIQSKDISPLIRQLESEHIRPENVHGAYVSLTGVPEESVKEECSTMDTVRIWMDNDTLFKEEKRSKRISFILKIYQEEAVKHFSMVIYSLGQKSGIMTQIVKNDTLFDISKSFSEGKLLRENKTVKTMSGATSFLKTKGQDEKVISDQIRYEYDYDPKGNWIRRYRYEDNILTEKIEREISYFH